MPEPERLTLTVASMELGGAARVLAILANAWAERGRTVTLVTIDSLDADFYLLDSRVARVPLDLMLDAAHLLETVRNNARRTRGLRKAVKASRPDAVVSFGDRTNILTLIATLGLDIPIVVSERTDPRQRHLGRIKGGLRRALYPHATALVVQSRSVLEWARSMAGGRPVFAIPNPVVRPHLIGQRPPIPLERPLMVAAGRLSPEKGYDRLLRAFRRCLDDYPDWSLTILGEGRDRHRLEALVRELGLRERVSLPGSVPDPSEVFAHADLFVLSSSVEGFPNALAEAMACGLPVVSFDCPSGPRDIVQPGVNGLLVPPGDIGRLAEAMAELMEDTDRRIAMGAAASSIVDRFSLESVLDEWERVLQAVTG